MHTGPKDYLNAEQYDEAYHSPEVVATPPMTALERQTSAETRQLASEMRNIPTAGSMRGDDTHSGDEVRRALGLPNDASEERVLAAIEELKRCLTGR